MDRLNLKFFIVIVLSILWTAGSSLSASTMDITIEGCDQRLAAVNSGEYVPFEHLPEHLQEWISLENEEQYSFYLLGSNGRTGNPYLVRDENGRPLFVYKMYLVKRLGMKGAPEEYKASDEKAFIELRKAVDRGLDLGFRIPTIQKTADPFILKLEYIPGRDLSSVLQDRAISVAIKERLLDIYNKKFEKLLRNFNLPMNDKASSDPHNRYKWYSATVTSPSGKFWILVKPDNVIVDLDTFEMTLIDPN